MESRFLLNVIIREGSAILQLLSGEDKTLLVGRDAVMELRNMGNQRGDGVLTLPYPGSLPLRCR